MDKERIGKVTTQNMQKVFRVFGLKPPQNLLANPNIMIDYEKLIA
jgi:hypothetical protein